jgi:hypothetical protein
MNNRKKISTKSQSSTAKNAAFDKVLKSPALNGGFDSLMNKIERISETQDEVCRKVDDVHQAIYDPDDGLFSRIRTAEFENNEKILGLKGEIEKIKASTVDYSDAEEETSSKISSHAKLLTEIMSWKVRVISTYRWIFGTLGVAGVGLIFKLVYDFIVKHVLIR